jgi:hypothetical protein
LNNRRCSHPVFTPYLGGFEAFDAPVALTDRNCAKNKTAGEKMRLDTLSEVADLNRQALAPNGPNHASRKSTTGFTDGYYLVTVMHLVALFAADQLRILKMNLYEVVRLVS